MKYRFIDQHRNRYLVSELCEALEVSVSGYYRWRSSVLFTIIFWKMDFPVAGIGCFA